MLFIFSFFVFFSTLVYSDGGGYKTIVVEQGDTCFSIAKKNLMTVEELKKVNKKTDYNLYVGEKLLVKIIEKQKEKQKETEKQKDNQNLQTNNNPKENIPNSDSSKNSIENSQENNIQESNNKIRIINTFGKQGEHSEGVIIAGKPGAKFYSPINGKIIYKGYLKSLGGDVIVVEFRDTKKKLKAIFINVGIDQVHVGQNIKANQFMGYIQYDNNMGVYVIVTDDSVFVPLYKILDSNH